MGNLLDLGIESVSLMSPALAGGILKEKIGERNISSYSLVFPEYLASMLCYKYKKKKSELVIGLITPPLKIKT